MQQGIAAGAPGPAMNGPSFNDFHIKLTAYAKALGYDCNIGICVGYAHMGKQAVLGGNMKNFDKRLEVLFSIPVCDIANKVNEVRQNVANFGLTSLDESQNEHIILEIPAFIESLILYVYFFDYQHLFDKFKLSYDVPQSMLMPDELQKNLF